MGQEASTSSNIQPADIQIPTSLRPIHPFLEDAQRNLCNARKAEDPNMVQKRKKIAVSCINHAFKVWLYLASLSLVLPTSLFTPFSLTFFRSRTSPQLMNILNLEWDAEGRACLDTFRLIRDSLSSELGLPVDPSTVLQEYVPRAPFPSHEIIVAEVSDEWHDTTRHMTPSFPISSHSI